MRRAWGTIAAVAVGAVVMAGHAGRARAFCGFYVGGAESSLYNDATMVVLMREGTRTVLSMQNDYQGPPEDFAMVVPVPVVLQQDNVKTLPREIFQHVDRLAAPRLVEYWEEDPCAPQVVYEMSAVSGAPRRMRSAPSSARAEELGVTIEAQFAVGEYDIVILSARDSSGLDTWLRQEGYRIPEGAEPVLRPYVQAGTKFFVAKVDVERVTFTNGRATLSPLRVHYDADEFSLPVRLGMINSSGTQDLIVHILARGQRYETANYPNVFIPTNVEVADAVRSHFGAFYAELFDRTLEVNPGSVVTEYSWMSGSCDPCPGPTLTDADILTLGGDVIAAGARRPGPMGYGGIANQFTLTRLHYRYGRGQLDEDLVFRAAPPVVGGRGIPDAEGVMQREVTPSSVNNFQGRYVILHRWEGAVKCENPRRGRWGGPPGGGSGPTPAAATNLGTQARGSVRLASAVTVPVPEIGLTPGHDPTPVPPPAAPEPAPEAPPAAPSPEASSGRCSMSPGASGTAGLFLVGLALIALTLRRRA